MRYKRYFIHFFTIATLLACLFCFVSLFAEPYSPIWRILLCYLCVVILFVLPMTAFAGSQQTLTTMLCKDEPEELAKIIQKTKRAAEYTDDKKKVYSYQSVLGSIFTRYGRWLTNSITVREDPAGLLVECPIAFQGLFARLEVLENQNNKLI